MKKLLLILAVLSFGCSTTVEPGTVGVAVDWGTTQDWTYPEGFHWVGFGVDVYEMNTQLQSYTMGDGEGEDRAIQCRTSDNLNVGVDVSVQFSLHEHTAPIVYRKLGTDYTGTVVYPSLRSAVRDAVAEFPAMEAVARRDRLGERMKELMRQLLTETLSSNGVPTYAIRIDNVLLRNVELPQELAESIARVQQQRNAAAERAQAIETARQEAERARIEAEGSARVAQIRAEQAASVRLIEARAESDSNLMVSRSITPQVLELKRIEAQRALLSNDNTRLVIGDPSRVYLNNN